MLAVIREGRTPRFGEILGNRERMRTRGLQRESHGAEIFFDVAKEGLANGFAVHHTTRNDGARNRTGFCGAQQETDIGNATQAVDVHGHRLHIKKGQS